MSPKLTIDGIRTVPIGIEEVKKLLGTPNIPGNEREHRVLAHWIHDLIQKQGEEYVKKYRRRIFADWSFILAMGLSRV